MISDDEVVWLYRCILGREPESAHVIEYTKELYDDFPTARSSILASREFLNAQMTSVYYRPDNSIMPAVKARANTLALASIVKNEENNIETMLLSCLSVVDFVALLDTGSSDSTVACARSLLEKNNVPFQIACTEFRDFSQARNAALDLVPPNISWILMLDADEHLVQEDFWRLNALLDSDVDGWQLPRLNFSDQEKREAAQPYPDYQRRLLRNRRDHPIRFHGAVHEAPVNVRTWGFAPASDGGREGFIGGPHIHHMGQVNLSLERWTQKHQFYSKLGSRREKET